MKANLLKILMYVLGLFKAAMVCLSLSGCIGSVEAKLTGSPERFAFEEADPVPILPKPQTEPLPPAAPPVERSRQPVPQPTVDTAPGEATLPMVLVYGPVPCVHCNRAEKELNDSGKYAATHATITPAIAKIAAEWSQGGYPIVTFRDRKGDERFVAPYRGLRDFDQRYNRTMKDRAATGLQDAAPPNVAAQPLNVREHLIEKHGYSRKQVDRMTDQECEAAHIRAHPEWNMQLQPQSKKQSRRQARGPGLLQRIFGGEG